MNTRKLWTIFTFLTLTGSSALYSQTSEIHYHNLDEIYEIKSRPHNFVINNHEECGEIFACYLRDFDFTTYTIIGVQGMSPGHFKPRVDIRIVEDRDEENISIEVILSGGKSCTCRVMKPGYRRVIYTNKLKPEYQIEFIYTRPEY